MDLVDDLQEEHREALRRLDRLQEALRGLPESGGGPSDEAVRRVESEWSWFREDLPAHFLKEEEVLFPVADAEAPDASVLLARMRAEHLGFEEMRARVVGSLDTIRHGCCGRAEAARRLRRDGTELCLLLRGHIRKEDDDLFPLIRHAIPAARIAALPRGIRAAALLPR